MRPTICLGKTRSDVKLSHIELGATVREKPGVSKVVTVNELDKMLATLENEKQSPSPDGMRMRLGPEPCCSQYHAIPSRVLMVNVLSIKTAR